MPILLHMFMQMQVPSCTCGQCIKDWLSPRLAAALSCAAERAR